ncbi:MAG: hypothetical protein WCI03_14365 [bacterium]|jgi:hypothetical protein
MRSARIVDKGAAYYHIVSRVVDRQMVFDDSVEDAFGRHRTHFSEKREEGARPMKGADWGDLFAARQLRVDIFGAPVPL